MMNAHDAAVATTQSDTMVIVSSVLSEFYEQNTPTTITTTSKILVKLLQNAIKETSDPKKQELFRRVRLSNAKIQEHVVRVEGALDVLGLAGFVEQVIGGDQLLVYQPQQQQQQSNAPGNALELYLQADGEDTSMPQVALPKPAHHALIDAICDGLEAKQKELEPWVQLAQQEKQKVKAAVNKTSTTNPDGTPFLADEERKARVAKMKAAKKAKELERAAIQARWQENMEERKEAERRREALLNAKVQEEAKQGAALGVTIRSANANAASPAARPLPKPFAPAVDPESQKEQLAAAARARMQRAQQQTMASASAPAQASSDVAAMDIETTTPQLPTASVAKAPPKDTAMEEEEDEQDQKPAAMEQVVVSSNNNNNNNEVTPEWKDFIQRVPRCTGAEGIRQTSYFHKVIGEDGMSVPMCLKRLFKELDGLKDSLPSDPNCSIWLRFDEETPQYIRALMTAPLPGPTPYSGGLFIFDIYIPGNYPQTSPKVQLLSTGGGKHRHGPNLYAEGKVCLSLLGTWPGPRWNPQHSSLYQVLISIQGLLLGIEHPYFLEPGHGGWEGEIKDGAFQQQGQTLGGKKVREEVGVPMKVVLYEDNLRVGTVKYTMIQPLKAASRMDKKDAMFQAFGEIIQAHFGYNREAILTEVQAWMSDHTYGRNRSAVTTNASLTIDQLQGLLPKLEQLLKDIPPLGSTASLLKDDAAMEEEEDKKMAPVAVAAAKLPPAAAVADDDEDKPKPTSAAKRTKFGEPTKPASSGNDGGDVLENKKQKMAKAAGKGDYVLAGRLQEEINRLEELQRSITEAAKENDFIRAGRLQAQYKALTATADSQQPAPKKKAPMASMWDQGEDDDEMFDEDDDDDNVLTGEDNDDNVDHHHHHDGEDDDSMEDEDEEGWAGPPPPGHLAGGGNVPSLPHGLGKNVFVPPGFKDKIPNKNHSWGTGSTLGDTAASASTEADQKVAAVATAPAAAKKSIPPEELCKLRVRLPNDKSVVLDFDKNDQLGAVYRCLQPMVPEEKGKKSIAVAAAAAAAGTSGAGAFSKPLSSYGFTLLLTRPKREFSLEMHGTKSLMDLNLAPSATLTVMRCSDRGIMYRGELESRLQQANGMAMDVDGLTYEGLVELTERVGTAGPKDGEEFFSMSAEELAMNSETFSPSNYLAELDSSMEEVSEDERKCPICLGDYDPTDETDSLRKLKSCRHIFHRGCVDTWLGGKSSCPLCKTSVIPEP